MPVAESQSRVAELRVLTGEPLPEGDGVLEFRLLYQGRLQGAERSSTRFKHKHELRREFHKQLKRLWSTKSPLRERLLRNIPRTPLNAISAATPEEGFVAYVDNLAERYSYHGYSFVPIVTEELFLNCGLEILLMRPEEPNLLIRGGDIDARVKTIFDALRVPTPQEAHELRENYPPTQDEIPMYCLLEDDKLVSEVKVTADHLLLLPGSSELRPNDAFLVVHVRVKPIKLIVSNLDFA